MANRHKVQKLKHGGKAGHHETHEEREHEIEHEGGLKRGGKVAKRAEGGRVMGAASKSRLDKRARGGGVGADKHPFSSAHIKGRAPAHNPGPK